MVGDGADGFRGQSVGQVFPGGAIREFGVPVGSVIILCGLSQVSAPAVGVEPLIFRVVSLTAQVPFSGEVGRIAGFLQGFGNRDLFQGEGVEILRPPQLAFLGSSPGIQSVILSRAGYLPVMMLARVGEQTGAAAYASVKRTPLAARRSV